MNQKKWMFVYLIGTVLSIILTGCMKKEPEFLIENFPAEEERFEEDGEEQIPENGKEDGTGFDAGSGPKERVETGTMVSNESNASNDLEIVVHICGAVNQEQVITLPAGSRVFDAVTRVGGLSKNADQSYVNLAEKLSDGEQIYIPTKAEVQQWEEEGKQPKKMEKEKPGEQQNTAGQAVNINTAGTEELCTLPGIGESRATSIIAYREENGPFQCIEDIMSVSGIKEAAFGKIKDKIVVSD